MYYLNAFNEMLRRRQQQNQMMGGEGYQGVGNAPPSGPMGLGPAQDRSGWRDAINGMSPFASAAMSMMPGVGPALGLAKAVNYGMSQYDKSQLSPADAAMAAARQGFQASEKSGYATPDYGYVDDSGDRLGFSGPTVGGPMSQSNITGSDLAPMAYEAVSSPVSQSSVAGTALAPMAYEAVSSPVSQSSVAGTALGALGGGLQGGGSSGSTGLYGDASAGMGGYGGFGGGGLGGSGDGDAGVGGGFGLYANGGMVHAEHLKGRAPAPDDGYGALQGGEYVITKAAVEKYGKRMMDAINNGTFR